MDEEMNIREDSTRKRIRGTAKISGRCSGRAIEDDPIRTGEIEDEMSTSKTRTDIKDEKN